MSLLQLPGRQLGCTCVQQPKGLGLSRRGKYLGLKDRDNLKTSICSSSLNGDSPSPSSSPDAGKTRDELTCILSSIDDVKDFETYDSTEITSAIQNRRTRIFLLMEEVRRLRIEQRLKGGEVTQAQELGRDKFSSVLPFLPPLEEKTLSQYYYTYAGLLMAILTFGGLVAPILEVKLGLYGMGSYYDFVEWMNLPPQLAQVDPIVASFCGGGIGVLSALLVVEKNNMRHQQKARCHYCKGTGYLMCGNCVGLGLDASTNRSCVYCAKSGKVMCTGCLCTGKQLATEHDPRIDPFD